MGRVLHFPIKSAAPGSVYCPPLDIYFPVLFRDENIVSASDLEKVGLAVELAGETIYHTIDQEPRYIGLVTRSVVRKIESPTSDSLVIRHHRSEDEALAYLDGVRDFGAEETASDIICRTSHGLFTCIRRPSAREWVDAPFVIYCAHHPADNIVGFDHWSLAVTASGVAIEGFEV